MRHEVTLTKIILSTLCLFTWLSCAESEKDSETTPVQDVVSSVDDSKKEAADHEEIAQMVFQAGSFEDPQVCSGCHSDIYNAWSKSMHASSWQNKWFQDDYILAHQETNGKTDMLCGPCHAPVAARTGLLPPADGSMFDDTSRRGISCDFCHTVSGVNQIQNLGHISEPGENKKGPRGDGNSPYHKVVYSEIHTKAEFCGACHQVVNPENGLAIIDTFDDWQNNDYGKQKITCQNCHMTPSPGIGKNPGSSAMGMGMQRDNIAFHGFVGANVYVQQSLGHSEQAKLAEQTLQAAAELTLSSKIVGSNLELTVDVHNIGAGHKIPTGTAYIRKIWLNIDVVNEAGVKIFSSGHILDNNHVDPNATFFRVLFRDEHGQLTEKSWRGKEIGYDNRIPAKGKKSQVYDIALPIEGQYTANAKLMYRSFSQASLDEMNERSGSETPPALSVEMASAVLTIEY